MCGLGVLAHTAQIANFTAHSKTPHYSGVFDLSYISTTYPYLTIEANHGGCSEPACSS
jgi:hypothetical protein